MGFRQYRRTSSGIDAAIHSLLYWLTIVTAPVWVPVLGIYMIYSYFSTGAESQASRHRMATSEIELSSMRLDAQGGQLNGRLHNKSTRFTVTDVGINIVLQDCDTAGCETIGQADVDIRESTPAGQARDFSEYIHFSGNPIARRGKLAWKYEVKYVDARSPKE